VPEAVLARMLRWHEYGTLEPWRSAVIGTQTEVAVETWDAVRARRNMGVPEDRFCAWLISLGVPADRRSPRSGGPTGGGSRTSCSAATGSSRIRLRKLHKEAG
jgi:hypothetical protein